MVQHMVPNSFPRSPLSSIINDRKEAYADHESSRKLSNDHSDESTDTWIDTQPEGFFHFRTKLVWQNIAYISALHIAVVYFLLTFDYMRDWKTTLWIIGMTQLSGFGITGGAHRLWSHRSYKAKWPLRVLLMVLFYSAGQNSIFVWVRDHRVHHKFTDTDADPHNSKRGFFFSHVGWLMMKKHPEVTKRGSEIDMSDILADPIVSFGDKYFAIFVILCAFVLPSLVPIYLWNETWTRAFISQAIMRYVLTLHVTWSVNSVAHMWGDKPFDANINPVQNIWVSMFTSGEGWHNYHHVFPWDYRTSEQPFFVNTTGIFLYLCGKTGLAYDMKEASATLIKNTALKRGDGSHDVWGEAFETIRKLYC